MAISMPAKKKGRNPNARAIVHLDRYSQRGERVASNWVDTWSDNYDRLVSESKAMLLPGHFSLTRLVRMSTTMTLNVYATMLSSCEELYGDTHSGTPSVKLWFDETFQTTDPVFVKVPRNATKVTAQALTLKDKGSIPVEAVIARLEDDGIASVKLVGLGKIVNGLWPGDYEGKVTVEAPGGTVDVAVTATFEPSEGA